MFIYAEYHWHCCKPAFRQASETRSENICRCFSGAKLVYYFTDRLVSLGCFPFQVL